MKKSIALLVLSIFVLVGCAKKDIVMDQTEVTLHHGETYQITAESHNPITYVSEDRYHAEVNAGGVVTAVCIGETDIKLSNGNDEKKLHVVVTPTNFCITEPNVNIGESRSSLVRKFGEPDMEEEEEGLTTMTYVYSDYAMIMMFLVDENEGLVAYVLGGMTNLTADMKVFLSERYLYLGPSDVEDLEGDAYINALTENDATLKIVHSIIENQMSLAIYSTPELMNEDFGGLKKSFSKFSQLARK